MRKESETMYKKDYLIDTLKTYLIKYGGGLSAKDYEKNKDKDDPGSMTFIRRFGSWLNAKEATGVKVDRHLCSAEMGRKAELAIFYMFDKTGAVDLSGQNRNSFCDGVDPDGKMYDVKSSKLHQHRGKHMAWCFTFTNRRKKRIDYYFLLGYDKQHEKLIHVWKIPPSLVSTRERLSIFSTPNSLERWSEYEVRGEQHV